MTQTEFQLTGVGDSQCARILAGLRAAAGSWVAMPELSSAGNPGGFCMVHSRIADLRHDGHNIPPARTEKVDGQIHSFYRLIE